MISHQNESASKPAELRELPLVTRTFDLPQIPDLNIRFCMHTDCLRALQNIIVDMGERKTSGIQILIRDLSSEQYQRLSLDPNHRIHLEGRLRRSGSNNSEFTFLMNRNIGAQNPDTLVVIYGDTYGVRSLMSQVGYAVKWVDIQTIGDISPLNTNAVLLPMLGGCNQLEFRAKNATSDQLLQELLKNLRQQIIDTDNPLPLINAAALTASFYTIKIPKDTTYFNKIIPNDLNKMINEKFTKFSNPNN